MYICMSIYMQNQKELKNTTTLRVIYHKWGESRVLLTAFILWRVDL